MPLIEIMCYSLVCAAHGCDNYEDFDDWTDSSSVAKSGRKDGWYVSEDEQIVYCPDHATEAAERG